MKLELAPVVKFKGKPAKSLKGSELSLVEAYKKRGVSYEPR